MASLLVGPVKYFIIALLVLFLAAAGAAVTYRASYRIEQDKREDVEAALRQTTASLDELTKSSKAALDAVTSASQTTKTIVEKKRTERERAIAAPNDQDGPVAPVLRDAILGVR